MILSALIAVLIASGASAEHARIIGEPGNGEKIPIDITVKDGHVITVSGQPDPPQPFFRQSINLYDLNKQLEARKVVEENVCYIRKFTGTYDQVKDLVYSAKANDGNFQTKLYDKREDFSFPIVDFPFMSSNQLSAPAYGVYYYLTIESKSKGTTQVSEDWNIPGKEIKAKDMKMTVGAKIADFCSGYKVFWVKVNMDVTSMQVGMTKRQWSGSLGGGWSQGSGASVTGGLNYDNGRGLSANLGGGWSQGGGWSASVGLKWRFR